jgi:hypothetical protein
VLRCFAGGGSRKGEGGILKHRAKSIVHGVEQRPLLEEFIKKIERSDSIILGILGILNFRHFLLFRS